MHCGSCLILSSPTLALCDVADDLDRYQRTAVTLPKHAVLTVLNISTEDCFVQVAWEGRHVFVFRIDLEERGEEIKIR